MPDVEIPKIVCGNQTEGDLSPGTLLATSYLGS